MSRLVRRLRNSERIARHEAIHIAAHEALCLPNVGREIVAPGMSACKDGRAKQSRYEQDGNKDDAEFSGHSWIVHWKEIL